MNSIMHNQNCDIAIITIVKSETRAVIQRLRNCADYQEWKSSETGRVYYSSTITEGEVEIRVVLTQALAMGNRAVANAFNAIRKDYRPEKIALLGIAGSIQKDVELCDVVIADRVIYYETRSETIEGPRRRGEFFKARAELVVQVNAFLVDHDVLVAASESYKRNFKVHFRPVASGEAVVKYREADVAKWVEVVNEKTACVEMEAAGFSEAAEEASLESSFDGVHWIIARGISDHADKDKDDRWQTPAVLNGFETLLKLAANWK